VKGAITTDFILSAEIMAITLTTVNKETSSIAMRAAVLAAVAVTITVAVYGAVAIIVKADEAGMWLSRSKLGFKRALGRAIVRGVPGFMTLLATVGTAAMLWVGGDIVIHGAAELGAPGPERVIYSAAEAAASAIPGAAGLVKWLVKAFFAAVIGVMCGGLVVLVKGAIAPLLARRKSSAST
jgi:predicted DNA repair protein MutK